MASTEVMEKIIYIVLSFAFIYVIHTANKDYRAFLNLPVGGIEKTFKGYLFMTSLRLIVLRNPCVAAPVPISLQNTGHLPKAFDTIRRPYPRPIVSGIAPQRQHNQIPPREIFQLLEKRIHDLAQQYPEELVIATSCFEKHSSALFARHPVNKTCKGEVVHAHPTDSSLHLTLHPADAKAVVESGFGQRHPLARGGFCTRWVPLGFILVYAPQNEQEVDIIMQIIDAAWAWVVDKQRGDTQITHCLDDDKTLIR